MSWTKHFQIVPTKKLATRPQENNGGGNGASTSSKFSSWLPEVYTGTPNRIERYSQYDQMDMDSEINASLDTIADFTCQIDENGDLPFEILYHEDPTESEIKLIENSLRQWCKLNDFTRRIWKSIRNTLKYGDQFFIRDPETYEWLWVDQSKVQSIVVNEAEGKEPEQYLIKDLDLNICAKTATAMKKDNGTGYTLGTGGAEPLAGGAMLVSSPSIQSRFALGGGMNEQVIAVDAEHVIHLSLSEGMDQNWPFGNSILEAVFKTYKQKELLEDSIIIYRVQRAPERRVFYVDVGNMPAHKAMAYVERIKNEIHQRRIPNRTGGGASILDAGYNPMSMVEDYFLAQSADGRGSKIETLPGGDNLGEIDDLKYFNNKLFRGLRVPSSYLPTGPDDGSAQYNDGRIGTAYIQEWRFSKYCQRLQTIMCPFFDREFKLYLKQRGINIHPTMYELSFREPQNFGDFKRMEIDSQKLNLFNQIKDVSYIAKRTSLSRYLGWSEDEIMENERNWLAENPSKKKSTKADNDGSLRDVGVTGGGGFDMGGGDMDFGGDDTGGGDLDLGDDTGGGDLDLGGDSPISGGEGELDL